MRRILLIEDDAVFRDHVAHAMRRAGFEVTCAADGESGWAALESANPELVLLDLVLPGASGLAVLRRLRCDDRWRPVPVLVLSAHSDKAADAVMNGAQGYLIKSRFTMTALVETVRRLMTSAGTPNQNAAQGAER